MTQARSVDSFLDDLASASPTPGGGGAAALMGASGAALVSMVGNLTLGKKNYLAVQDDIRALLETSESLRWALTEQIDRDAEVFDRVMAAYALPKMDEAQQVLRSARIQEALRDATDVPLSCARQCLAVIELSRIAAEKGNRNVLSDAGAAVMAAYAGFKTAALNVRVNVASIKDTAFATNRLAELSDLEAAAERAAREIYDLVRNGLGS